MPRSDEKKMEIRETRSIRGICDAMAVSALRRTGARAKPDAQPPVGCDSAGG
jgi:hypothetical protein